jgi:hypothetical protein
MIEIPKIENEDFKHDKPNSPGWIQPVRREEGDRLVPIKPIIRCNCGKFCGIGLHHVHADGTVTASFFHARTGEHQQGTDDGCGWHVFLKLKDWNGGEFPPCP